MGKNIKFNSLGLDYHSYVPDDQFQPYILNITEISGCPSFHFERLTPTNFIDILINLGEDITGSFNGQQKVLRQGEFVIRGNQHTFFDSILPPRTHFISIHLTNLGFKELFSMPSSELFNSISHQPDHGILANIIDQILETHSFSDLVENILDWIMVKVKLHDQIILGDFIMKTLASNPYLASKELQNMTGYSAKYLNRVLKNFSGHTISYYKRICRFNKTISSLRSKKDCQWTDLIYHNHFYDQSHFIKEIKHFSGLTPSELSARYRDNHLNITFE